MKRAYMLGLRGATFTVTPMGRARSLSRDAYGLDVAANPKVRVCSSGAINAGARRA